MQGKSCNIRGPVVQLVCAGLVMAFAIELRESAAQPRQTKQQDVISSVEAASGLIEKLHRNYAQLAYELETSTIAQLDKSQGITGARQIFSALRVNIINLVKFTDRDGQLLAELVRTEQSMTDKLRTLANDDRFSQEHREILISQWQRLLDSVTKARVGIEKSNDDARRLLVSIDRHEALFDEYFQLRLFNEALRVLQGATSEVRESLSQYQMGISQVRIPGG